MLEAAQEMVADSLIERFGIIPVHISQKCIKGGPGTMMFWKGLFRQVLKCQNIGESEAVLDRV